MLNLRYFITILLIKLTLQHCPPVKTVCKIFIKKISTLQHLPQKYGMYRCSLKLNTCPKRGITVELQNTH